MKKGKEQLIEEMSEWVDVLVQLQTLLDFRLASILVHHSRAVKYLIMSPALVKYSVEAK